MELYLAEVRVWRKALSLGTILYNMHQKLNTKFATSVVLYFPLDDNN